MIRALVVEDSPIIRQSLCKSIERYDGSIVVSGEAMNGVKALEWLEHHHADLCITDIKMPAMDGLELIDAINHRYPWMASIVVSSYDDFEYARQSIQLKALDYILKPIDEQLLHASLDNVSVILNRQREKDAAHLLLQKLPFYHSLMDRWVEHIKTSRVETMPTLIVDTLDRLEQWIDGRYELLHPIAKAWVRTVRDECQERLLQVELSGGEEHELGFHALPIEKVRFFSRLQAVQGLEEGANRLLSAIRGLRDEQNARIIEEIKKMIRESHGRDVPLQRLAEKVALNKTYMCTLFKQETDMTIGQYMIVERMNAARELLVNSSDRVYEVANAVGYEDVDYFTMVFKKHFGLTPVEYRKRMIQ